jgi:hypothetical protein
MSRKINGLRKKMVAAAQKWQCATCEKLLEATFEVDHVIRVCDGGSDGFENLQALCKECHGRKTLIEQMLDIERNHIESSKEKLPCETKLIKCLWCHEIIEDAHDPHQRYHNEIRVPFDRSCKHLQKLATHKKWKAQRKLASQVSAFVW